MAAITNFHKVGGLKQWKLILSQFRGQKSEISTTELKPRCWQGHTPFPGSRGESVSCLFPLPVAASLQSLRPASSSSSLLCFHIPVSSVCQISPCLSLLRTFVIALRLTWIIQDNFLISGFLTTPAKDPPPLLPYKVTQVSGIKTRISFRGSFFSLSQTPFVLNASTEYQSLLSPVSSLSPDVIW